MSPAQLKKLQELSQVFGQGKANPKQIQQLSALLAQINHYENHNENRVTESERVNFISASRFG